MRKILFKKLLQIIDTIELYQLSFEKAPIVLYEQMINDYYAMRLKDIEELFVFLRNTHLVIETNNGIDLTPAATIYAKSNQNSSIEALSIFECFLHVDGIYQFFYKQVFNNEYIEKATLESIIPKQVLDYFNQTILFDVDRNYYRIQPKIMDGVLAILEEYRHDESLLLSSTLLALYTSSIVSHGDLKIAYKNTNEKMVPYKNKTIICGIIPRRGIPHDRDETKALQAFYKDTLFHEFGHACPICNICIPHMLIASHIKPFRDCAHIYEAVDYNNGLLLCRNHDYLFDQGYFTFDDQGYVIFSEEFIEQIKKNNVYSIQSNYQLPKQYLTFNRRLFLQYHRTHIFKDADKYCKKRAKE